MKKYLLRALTITLALLMLFATVSLIACVDEQQPDETTASVGPDLPPEDESTEVVYTFPTANYNNKEFIIISRSPTAASYPAFYIDTDVATDTMSSAVHTRNLNTEDYYGVQIIQRETSGITDVVKNAVDTGTMDFDVILEKRDSLASISKNNYLYDFNKLDIDFSKPWWDINCANDYEINGKLFIMANDTSVSNLAGARFLYFNKNLVDEYQLPDPHDYIRNNEWILDNFLSMVKSVHKENGDGIRDGQDVYGLIQETGSSNGVVLHWLVGCGVRFSETNADGEIVVNIDTNKVSDILSTLGEVLQSNECVTNFTEASTGADTSSAGNKFNYCRALFAEDHFLFIQANMGTSNQFSEIDGKGYGVAPNPMYNTDQERYYHKMDMYSNIWAIPNAPASSAFDFECVANVMDYWAYQSSKTVMPAYYEITIKTRRVVDPFDSEILDVIKGSIVYDISDIYDIPVASSIYTGYEKGTFSSSWRNNKIMIDRSIGRLNDIFAELD